MIYDVVLQNSICERDELCTSHWIVRTLSNSYRRKIANYEQNYARA